MKTTREVTIEADELYPIFYLNDKYFTGEEVRMDESTVAWVKAGMSRFAEVQEYLRSIHPDYMER